MHDKYRVVGAYLPTHNSPMFLRMAMLQLENQTHLPNVIEIYENSTERNYEWAIEDVKKRLLHRGILVNFTHDPRRNPEPYWQLVPLKKLYEEGCEVFFKIDQDDMYFERHIEVNLNELSSCDMVCSRYNGYMVTRQGKPFYCKQITDFDKINPIRGAAGTVAFNRAFAAQYIKDLEATTIGTQDDVVLAETMKKFNSKVVRHTPTYCYISHGGNVSTGWDYDRLVNDLENNC